MKGLYSMAHGRPVRNLENASRYRQGMIVYALFLALAAICFLSPSRADAACAAPGGGVAASSCDCQYWESMKARAWLEAQREITQNQNLIFKPDSVLEYVCFDSIEREKALRAGALFSDTNAWPAAVQKRGCLANGQCLDLALQDVTHRALLGYLQANFSHNYLGGRMAGGGAPSGLSIIGGGDYVCDAMIRVWEKSKCYGFAQEAPDGFLTFEEHRANDPRRYPTPCQPDPRWQPFLNTALVTPPWYVRGNPANQQIYNSVREKMLPGACSAPVPTGVQVQQQGNRSSGFGDAFCTNPGCTFNGTTCSTN